MKVEGEGLCTLPDVCCPMAITVFALVNTAGICSSEFQFCSPGLCLQPLSLLFEFLYY